MVVFCCRDCRDHHSGAVSRDRNLVEHFEVHELTPDALFCDGELFHALISRKRGNWIFYDILRYSMISVMKNNDISIIFELSGNSRKVRARKTVTHEKS